MRFTLIVVLGLLSLIIESGLCGSVKIGSPCQATNDCVGQPGGRSECSLIWRCRCLSTHVTRRDNNECLPIINTIGATCSEKAQCTVGTPGSLSDCISSKCACSSEGVASGNICLKKATLIGDACTTNVQCTVSLGSYGVCTSSKCGCNSNSVQSADRRSCLPKVNVVGGTCTESTQCQQGTVGSLSTCVTSGTKKICSCNSNAVASANGQRCLLKATLVGGTCEENGQCTSSLGNPSQCTNRLCVCTPGVGVQSSDRKSCLPIINAVGGDCLEPQQCQQGTPGSLSTCAVSGSRKICSCGSTSVASQDGKRCLQKATLVGDTCTENSQCTAALGTLSTCSGGRCQCNSVSVESSNKRSCLAKVNNVGGTCTEVAQCQGGTLGQLSQCVTSGSSKICNCTSTAVASANGQKCLLKTTLVGGSCEDNLQCTSGLGSLSQCLNRQCVCKSGLGVQSNDRKSCLPIVNTVGADCLEPQQCQQGTPGSLSTCAVSGSRKICSCGSTAVASQDGKKCLQKAALVGDNCTETSQCTSVFGSLSLCSGGRCQCNSASVESSNKRSCLAKVNNVGETCTEMAQCQGGTLGQLSQCVTSGSSKICNCTSTAVASANGQRCLPKATTVGGACEENLQCSSNLGSLSHCLNNQCVCKLDGVESIDKRTCLAIVNMVGGACHESQQCQKGSPGEQSECLASGSTKVCTCTGNTVESSNGQKCLEKAALVGGPCEDHVQCSSLGIYGQCVEGACSCGPSAVESSNGRQCLQKAVQIRSPCEEVAQCTPNLGEFSICLEGGCDCQANVSVANDNQSFCLPIVNEIGGACQESQQCQEGSLGQLSDCILSGSTGICNCSSEAVPSENQQICLPKAVEVGDECETDAQCTVKLGDLSHCHDNQCSCKSNAIPSINNSSCLPVVTHPEQDCVHDSQCQHGALGPWSSCKLSETDPSQNVCTCDEDTITISGDHTCYKKAVQVGDSCEVPEQCTPNLGHHSNCVSSTCECQDNSTSSSNKYKCLLKVDLGEPCEDNAQCAHIPDSASCLPKNPTNSEEGFFCQCSTGFMTSPENNACFKLASVIGDTCEQDPGQCAALEAARCVTGDNMTTCECDYEKEVVSEKRTECLEKKDDVFVLCEESVQCQVNNSVCVEIVQGASKICMCLPGKFTESRAVPKSCVEIVNHLGDPCLEDNQCMAGHLGIHSECKEGACSCTPKHELSNGICTWKQVGRNYIDMVMDYFSETESI